MMKQVFAMLAIVGAMAVQALTPRAEVPIRDPFVVVEKGTYFLYHARRFADGRVGVAVRQSKDLEFWTSPQPVLQLPPEIKHTAVWAPEVHRYAGAWWIFATITFAPNPAGASGADVQQPVAMLQKGFKGGELRPRGVWIFKSDSPMGPFKPVKKGPVTPREWMCLDGTLWVEDGVPWMVFCHEWCQTGNGRMMAAPMSKDLTHFTAKPVELFRAADVPKAAHVTDGPFLLRPNGLDGLRLIWSNFLKGSGYCVLQAKSVSGKVAGPWQQLPPIYRKDGGHGMCFTRLDGQLMLALHQPNHGGLERLHLFPLKAEDGRLVAQEKIEPNEPLNSGRRR